VQEFAKANSKRPALQVALFFNNSEIDENENLITPSFISYLYGNEAWISNAKKRDVIAVFRKQFLTMDKTERVVLVHTIY
jgi:hypothetical protein